ncbi:hypothetical protein BBK36DRAFT_1120443 [Trichoderma citrinoviride]|uniref:Conidiation protein 6 n=1 Tax=Trichoderma citrinoviride TaxID=58853 RepID=A0A2T4B962_9HYPO|nr:hypothetical protein BBK36DRAFT_1120443 [Trichoderma citrinoviride]PTB65872.1 hypothetical protein BBK36DRAFT_1120443 [Trichoderma citrinoviride]
MADQDDYSDIPKEVPLEDDYRQDPENVARGHKATLANPNVSDAAKQHSRSVLENEFQENEATETTRTTGSQSKQKDPGNVARGLKASLANEGVSAEAKENAKQKLQEMQ